MVPKWTRYWDIRIFTKVHRNVKICKLRLSDEILKKSRILRTEEINKNIYNMNVINLSLNTTGYNLYKRQKAHWIHILYGYHHHHHHQQHNIHQSSFKTERLWGMTDDFGNLSLQSCRFSAALWDLINSRTFLFLILSSYLFLCQSCFLSPFHCAFQDGLGPSGWPWRYYCRLHIFTMGGWTNLR